VASERDLSKIIGSANPTTRRAFLKQSVALGLAIPSAAALLAACATDDEVEEDPLVDPVDEDDDAEPVDDTDDDVEPDDEPEEDDTEPVDEDDRYGGTMVGMAHTDVNTLGHDFGESYLWGVCGALYNALVETDHMFEQVPVLAEDYEMTEDGLQYTFHLREGVLFHDGVEFTAEDAKYTFEWGMDPESAANRAAVFVDIDSVEAVDDYTFVVNMAQPYGGFMTGTARSLIVPAHYHGELGHQEASVAPIGTGAFKLVEFRAADSTLLEAFEDHFRGRPYLDNYRYDVVPEASVRAIALETGEGDTVSWPILVEDNLRFEEDPNFTVYRTSPTWMTQMTMNNEHPALSEPNVRKAVWHAIDRQGIIDSIWQGAGVLVTSTLSPAVVDFFEPDTPQYDYDPDLAVELLEEAGWELGDDGVREKDGVRLSWTAANVSGAEDRRPALEAAQQMVANVGMEMELIEQPFATIADELRSGDLTSGLIDWGYGGIDGDGTATLRSDARNNWNHYHNDRVDELLDQGRATPDVDARREIYSELQKLVMEDVPFFGFAHRDFFNVFTGRIKGLPEDALFSEGFWRLHHTWWIEES
jgi:peptide/nickel transport system substrate-binding protein